MLKLFIVIALILIPLGYVGGQEKIVIGAVEDVILLPSGVKLPARIDTGAAKSSLDARALRIHGKMVEFRIPDEYGGTPFKLPIIEWRHVRSAETRGRRPVVEIDLCIGSRQIRARVNLNDRSMVKYPLILGRNVLQDQFVVDVKRSKILVPNCPDPPAGEKPVTPQPLPTSK
jgi:hypothetical protein